MARADDLNDESRLPVRRRLMCSADFDVLPLNFLPIYFGGSLSLNGMVFREVKEKGERRKEEGGCSEVDVQNVRMVHSRYPFEPRYRSVFL